jgi:hypothetical protein
VGRSFLAETIAESASALAVLRKATLSHEETHRSVHSIGVHKLARPNARLIRDAIPALHDDAKLAAMGLDDQTLREAGFDRAAFLASIRESGFSLESLTSAAFAPPDEALECGDLVECVRRRRRDDRGRVGRHSDAGDEAHLPFALCADVFTVDANIAHILRAAFERPIKIEGRGPDEGNRTWLFPNGHLVDLANALRRLADDWRESHADGEAEDERATSGPSVK